MASLYYLWSKRAKPTGLYASSKTWLKRIFTFRQLLISNSRKYLLISKGSSINETAEIGKIKTEGKKNKLSVGEFSFLGQVFIALHDEVIIGSRVCINDGVKLLTASHDVKDPLWGLVSSKIIIEDYVWIGMNAIILPGVTLGRGVVVGAGAVVGKSVAAGSIVIGNPAVALSKKRSEHLNYNPCENLATNLAWLKG